MKLSYPAFELAVDRILSSTAARKTRSVYDLPQRELLQAYHSGMTPEEFTDSLGHESAPATSSKDSPDQSSLF